VSGNWRFPGAISLFDWRHCGSFYDEKKSTSERLSPAGEKLPSLFESGISQRYETADLRCWPKSKGANLPQSWRLTLQSQFSQGESMNECILKALTQPRVAKTLR